ncbi:hypothetical protein NAV28_09115 [Pseudomonas stutzeri]|nr:hypothetical protein [Stutzerimonas degradans]
MNKLIIIVAPQGAGKTTNAAALKEAFGCERIVDNWDGRARLEDGDLALTNCTTFEAPKRARVLSLAQAMSEAQLAA